MQQFLARQLVDVARRCAASIGIDYAPPAPASLRPAGVVDGLLGLVDAEFARVHGYRVAVPGVDPGEVGDPVNALSPNDAEAFGLAYFGPPATQRTLTVADHAGRSLGGLELGDGCLSEFYADFFSSRERYEEYFAADMRLQAASIEATRALEADAEYASLVDAWSTCMRAQGYEFSSPIGPFDVEWPTPRPSSQEIATAIADTLCKTETGFVDGARRVRARLDEEVLDRLQLLPDVALVTDLAQQHVD